MPRWLVLQLALVLGLAVGVPAWASSPEPSRRPDAPASDEQKSLGAATVSAGQPSGGRSLRFVEAGPALRPLSRVGVTSGVPRQLRAEPSEQIASETQPEVRVLLVLSRDSLGKDLVSVVGLSSVGADGEPLDSTGELRLSEVACPGSDAEALCLATEPLTLVLSRLDRSHPNLAAHSLLVALHGRIVAETASTRFSLGVGPTPVFAGSTHALGDSFEVDVRVHVVRVSASGDTALGADDLKSSREIAAALDETASVLAQCGIVPRWVGLEPASFSPPAVSNLLTVGCLGGLPASGGSINLRAGKSRVRVRTRRSQSPLEVALELERGLQIRGYQAKLSLNAQTEGAARRSIDLSVRDRQGRPVALAAPPGAALSNDPSLRVCLGQVDFGDGLEHFDDLNAAAGTVEERTLLRQLEDGDPSTVELTIVPEFAGKGRIGESFIHSPGGSLENIVVVDRSGLQAVPRSMTIAHEMGHVLLHVPGHPDDFGVDQPWHLMDADASDASVFGPRRLDAEDCLRLRRQAGPGAHVPLLKSAESGTE